MPVFKIHRIRDAAFQQFRWAPHASGATQVKHKDYQPGTEIEADTPYEAWARLRDAEQPLRIGDLLESEDSRLYVCKYVGFEDAAWFVPVMKPAEVVLDPPSSDA